MANVACCTFRTTPLVLSSPLFLAIVGRRGGSRGVTFPMLPPLAAWVLGCNSTTALLLCRVTVALLSFAVPLLLPLRPLLGLALRP